MAVPERDANGCPVNTGSNRLIFEFEMVRGVQEMADNINQQSHDSRDIRPGSTKTRTVMWDSDIYGNVCIKMWASNAAFLGFIGDNEAMEGRDLTQVMGDNKNVCVEILEAGPRLRGFSGTTGGVEYVVEVLATC